MAYAEGWVLIHYLLRSPEKTRMLRDYLDAIRPTPRPLASPGRRRGALREASTLDRDLKSRVRGCSEGENSPRRHKEATATVKDT